MAFNLTANLNVALNTGSLRSAVNQVNSSFNNASKLKLGVDRGSFADIGRIKAQVIDATDSMQQFGYQAGLAAKRFAAFTVTAGSIITLTQTMREAVSAAIDFDREMVRLAQVSNDSSAGVQSVAAEITRLSTNFGVSSKDLLNVAITLKQANLSLKDTKIALEAMAQAALAPNFDNLKSTTEGAIAIMNQFNVSAKDLGGALGAVNVVAGEFAVEAGDIIEAVRKTGGAFKAAGGNLNELIALFTAVRQTTRESAETIGTGLRTIFTRIQRNDTAEALKQVGIQLRYTRQEALGLGDANLENQFVGPYEAIRRLAQGLEQLRGTDPRFSAIVEQLGGYRQISKVIPLIKEFGIAQKALGIAQAGQASLALNAGQAQDALAIKLTKLKEQFLEVGRGIVNSPGFRSLVDVFINASGAVLKLIDSLKGMLPLIAALGAIKIGKSLAGLTSGFLKGVSAGDAKKASGGFIRMKKGGVVPGSGNGDIVPALLEPGELIVPKNKVVRKAYKDGDYVTLQTLGKNRETSSINTLINKDKKKLLNKTDEVRMTVKEKEQRNLTLKQKEKIYKGKGRLSDEDVKLYSDPNIRRLIYASDNKEKEASIQKEISEKDYNFKIEDLQNTKKRVASAEAIWGKRFERIVINRNKKRIQAATRPKGVAESTYPVDTETKGKRKTYGDVKFKTNKEEYNDLLSKQLRARLYKAGSPRILGFTKDEGDKVDLGKFEYYSSYNTKKGLGAKGDFLESLSDLHERTKPKQANLGGPIQKFAFGGFGKKLKNFATANPFKEFHNVVGKAKSPNQAIGSILGSIGGGLSVGLSPIIASSILDINPNDLSSATELGLIGTSMLGLGAGFLRGGILGGKLGNALPNILKKVKGFGKGILKSDDALANLKKNSVSAMAGVALGSMAGVATSAATGLPLEGALPISTSLASAGAYFGSIVPELISNYRAKKFKNLRSQVKEKQETPKINKIFNAYNKPKPIKKQSKPELRRLQPIADFRKLLSPKERNRLNEMEWFADEQIEERRLKKQLESIRKNEILEKNQVQPIQTKPVVTPTDETTKPKYTLSQARQIAAQHLKDNPDKQSVKFRFAGKQYNLARKYTLAQAREIAAQHLRDNPNKESVKFRFAGQRYNLAWKQKPVVGPEKPKYTLAQAREIAAQHLRDNPDKQSVRFRFAGQQYNLARKVAPVVAPMSREERKAQATRELAERTAANVRKKEENRRLYEQQRRDRVISQANQEDLRRSLSSRNLQDGIGFNAQATPSTPFSERIRAKLEYNRTLQIGKGYGEQFSTAVTSKQLAAMRKSSSKKIKKQKSIDFGSYFPASSIEEQVQAGTQKINKEVQKLKEIKKEVGNPYKPEIGSTQMELFPKGNETRPDIAAKRNELLARRKKTEAASNDEAEKRRKAAEIAIKNQMALGLDIRSIQKERYGFASGGLVPGVGNSDTVPMNLPEGSFVIRKSSVNKIGADRLAKMGRYASGGSVPSLLTPGEYVFSPKEASRIGASKLHSMNKFAKFAEGGNVSKILSSADFNSPDQMKKIFKQLIRQIINENPTISRGDAISKAKSVMVDIKAQADKVSTAATQTQNLQKAYSSAEKGLEQAQTAFQASSDKLKTLNANLNSLQQQSSRLANAQANAASQIATNNAKLGVENARLIAAKAKEAAATTPAQRTKAAADRAKIEADILRLNQENAQYLRVVNAASKQQAALAPQITQAQADVKQQQADVAGRQQTVTSRTARRDTAKKAFEQGIENVAKAQKDFQYDTDETGNVTRKGRIVGTKKPMRGPGTFDFQTKEEIGNIQGTFGIRGNAAKGLAKQKIADQYQTAVYKQLKARAEQLGKQLDEAELEAAAQDYTEQFQKGRRKAIIKDGKVVGDVGIGQKLSKGSSRFFGYKETGEAKLGTKLVTGAKGFVGQFGAAGAAVGANLLASSIRAGAPTAESVVKAGVGGTVDVDQGRADAMRSTLAFSGALEKGANYAATAGSALAVFGPAVAGVGAGVAGLVGAVKGYKDGVLDADRQLREAKIGVALENLQGVFDRVANGLEDVNDSTARIITENQKLLSEQTGQKAFDVAGGNKDLFDRLLSGITGGGFQGLDVGQLNAELRKQDQQALAQQAVGIQNVLSKFSEQIGKQAVTDVRVAGGDVSGLNFEDFRKNLTKSLNESSGGFGRQQIAQIAKTKNISIDQAEKEFVRIVQESFNAEKLKQVSLKAAAANEKTITSMQALSNAVNAAAFASDRFSSRLETNTDLFEGRIGSLKLPNFAEQFSSGTPDLNAFNAAISDTSNALGVFGKQFREQGNAVNVAAQALPDILAGAVANPISGQDVSTQISDGLREALKQRGVTGGAAETVISSVAGAASGQDYEKLLAEAGGDVGKLSQKLLSGISEPLLQAFKDIASKTNEAANQYLQGLTELANRQKQISDSYSKLDSLRLESQKFAAKETARAVGLPSQAEEFTSYAQMTQGFRNRQQRLTGFGAGAAEDPQAIANRLRTTQQAVRAQEEKVKTTSTTSNAGADFRSAAEELTRLKSSASDLQDALKNLTDQSEKVAAAEQKLEKIRSDRDIERSFGRKLLTADPEEQLRIAQGQQLANIAQAQGGNISNFNLEARKILFEFLDNFGPVGKDIADKIVENTTGLGGGRKDEEKKLVDELRKTYKTQEDAQKLIIENQKTLQQDYFSNLDSKNQQFYAELQKFTNELQKSQMVAERGREQQKLAKIEDVQKNAKFLGDAGIGTKEEFDATVKNRGNILALANAQKTLQENKRMQIDQNKIDFNKISNFVGNGNDATANVQKAGQFRNEINSILEKSFDPQVASQISEQFRVNLQAGMSSRDAIQTATASIINSKFRSSQEAVDKLSNSLGQGAIGDKLRNLASEIANGKIDETQFTRAIDGIRELNLGVGQGLTEAATNASTRIDELNASINNLGGIKPVAVQPQQVGKFAAGGSIFKARGTDTVPAMLTPGEFVVNRKSAQQNLPLLRSINNGTNYLKNGGIVGPQVPNYPFEEFNNIIEFAKIKYEGIGGNDSIYRNINFDTFDDRTFFQSFLSGNEIIESAFSKYKPPIYKIYQDGFPELYRSKTNFLSLNPNYENWKGIDNQKIAAASLQKSLDNEKYQIALQKITRAMVEVGQQNVSVLDFGYGGQQLGTGASTILTLGRSRLKVSQKEFNDALALKYLPAAESFKADHIIYNEYVDSWLEALKKFPEKEKGRIESIRQEEALQEQERLRKLKESEGLNEEDFDTAINTNEFTKIFEKQQAFNQAMASSQINTKEGRLKTSKEVESAINDVADLSKGFGTSGLARSSVSGENAEKTAKSIQGQDTLFFNRKLQAQDLAKILLQRQAQAQTLTGTLLELQNNPNITPEELLKIDPMTLIEKGHAVIKNILDGKASGININTLKELKNQNFQEQIIASYIKLKSFQNASKTTGKEFAEIMDVYGKEGAEKDPQVLIEKLVKEKAQAFPNDISGYKPFVTANVEGKINYYKLLKQVAAPYNLTAKKVKDAANRGANPLDTIIEFQRRQEQTFIKQATGMEKNLVKFSFGKPTEIDFSETEFQTVFPWTYRNDEINKEKLDEIVKNKIENRPAIEKKILDKTQSVNSFLSLMAFAIDGKKTISKFGLLGYPTNAQTFFDEFKKFGGLLKLAGQFDEKTKTRNYFARIGLLENNSTNAVLKTITDYIRSPKKDLGNKNDVAIEPEQEVQDQQQQQQQPNDRAAFFARIGEADPLEMPRDELAYGLYLERMNERFRNNEISAIEYLKYVQQKNPEQKNLGGLVNYLAGGGVPSYRPNPDPSFFKPKGTDTVPAMLTPGEFVVRKSAAQANLPLLHAINSGTNYLSKGGIAYLYGGGLFKTPDEIKREREKAYAENRDAITASWAGGYGLGYYERNPEKYTEDVKKATDLAVKATGGSNPLALAMQKASFGSLSTMPGGDAQVSAAQAGMRGMEKSGILSADMEDVEATQKMLEYQKSRREELQSQVKSSIQQSNAAVGSYLGGLFNNPDAKIAEIKKRINVEDLNGTEPGLTNEDLAVIEIAKRKKYIELFGKTPEQDADLEARNPNIARADKRGPRELLDTVLPLAYGGSVPGFGNGDTIPAMLTPGEFVINKNAASRFGLSNLNKINGYANGGLVGYYRRGGYVEGNSGGINIEGFTNGVSTFSSATSQFATDINNFNTSLNTNITLMSEAFSGFNTEFSRNINSLLEVAQKIPSKLDGNLILGGNIGISIQQDIQMAVDNMIQRMQEYVDQQISGLQGGM